MTTYIEILDTAVKIGLGRWHTSELRSLKDILDDCYQQNGGP